MPAMIDSFDIAGFRQTLGRFATGVTVVTALSEGRAHGMTANSFTAVSLTPPLVLVSIDNRARMREILGRSGRYGISILHAEQRDVSGHFAGRPIDGLAVEFDWLDGIPLIAGALAHLVCSIHDTVPAGDHTLQIGHVYPFRRPERIESGAPLIFFASRYAPVHAPGAEAKG